MASKMVCLYGCWRSRRCAQVSSFTASEKFWCRAQFALKPFSTAFNVQNKAELLAIRKKRKAHRQAGREEAGHLPEEPPQVRIAAQAQDNVARAPATGASTAPELDSGSDHRNTRKEKVKSIASSRQQSKPAPPAPVLDAKSGEASALPKGFFDDKKSDALAHGEKLRTAKDDAKDLESFQREMDQLEEQRNAVAAQEAEAAAERAAAQEVYDNKCEFLDMHI
jgi:hypothetical protein